MSGLARPGAVDPPGAQAASAAVTAAGVEKVFGFRRVLEGVSIEVPRGSFLSLFGPNGAGKTTLIKILTTVSRPSAGTVTIAGMIVGRADAGAIRSRIGYLSHQTLLYDGLSGLENLVFFGRIYGVAGAARRAEDLLGQVGLWERRHDRAGTYSRGMLQRLAIARALVHDPEILLLDEPFTGLDPEGSRLLLDLLGGLRKGGRSAVLVTHDLAGGLELSDHWAILAAGRIAARGASRDTRLETLTSTYFQCAGASPDPQRDREDRR